MRYRVIFPTIAYFPNLMGFIIYFRDRIHYGTSLDYDANFFLFGEDILAVMAGKTKPVPYEDALSVIPALQEDLNSNDFVIFSCYCTVGSILCNASFLVGRKQWFFDLKHTVSFGDMSVICAGGGKPKGKVDAELATWKVNAILNRRSAHCLRSGKVCIKSIYPLVCTDIALLSKMRVRNNFLVFAPANELDSSVLSDYLPKLRASGYLFINDPHGGNVWSLPFGKAAKPAQLKEGPRGWYHFLDFELN